MKNYSINDVEYLKKYLSADKLEDGLKQLEEGVPVQYIVGNVDFFGNIVNVDDRVLIPRFETELLVDKTIKYIKDYFDNARELNILDIGTGSGCIAITLKKSLGCKVSASDISCDALVVAKGNAISNNVDIKFIHSDVFSDVEDKFDVIISNPPYISYDEDIEDIVKNNEPSNALYASDNGLFFYDKILRECSNYLNDKFFIAFEIGMNQGESVKKLAYKYLGDIEVLVEKDYSDKDRFVFIKNK